MTMVVGVDQSEHSYYVLQWALHQFFPSGQPHQYRLIVVIAKPAATSAIGFVGPAHLWVGPLLPPATPPAHLTQQQTLLHRRHLALDDNALPLFLRMSLGQHLAHT
ncbi:hypothetical protein PR202_ga03565 [Eleusine coracana subsp. coracana]|uniref:Uncharacterized protein n=1 Tax=Eleusine coracana subsp. coracana TaxID=191504 RepID=A0AAV5BNQ0_ELECO|nr:hypothetical protein PR202_ga03565 [Eleusine coracana subsp. coracana]